MTQAEKDFANLFVHSKKIRLLESISGLLEWDQETHMPPGGAQVRAEQIELIASLIHQERTSRTFASSLSKLIDLKSGKTTASGLNPQQRAALREWRRDYTKAIALPNDFVKQFAHLAAEGVTVWTKARKENCFKTFSPYLEKIVSLSRKKADYLGYDDHPYDALLDCFEPDMNCKLISPIFQKLQQGITALVKKIIPCKQVDDSFLHGKFSVQKQLDFSKKILQTMGYDLQKGRLDLSTHPFSVSMHPFDSRITSRIHPTSIFDCISSVMHEAGHGLYEMGLLADYYGSPLCEAVSTAIHESQSRFWETRIGQTKPFWHHFLPLLKKEFKGKFDSVTLEQFYHAINKVEPSFIRVESDEVTYSLHVILRYELEKQLIEGSLKVKEVPEAWNDKMEKYLGVRPSDDRQGCLQDIHWSMGSFGYFPTYALGNLYAAHLFEVFEKAHPDWQKKVEKGELLFIKEWLGEMVHKHGRAYPAAELLKRLDGGELSPKPYLNYLTQKYQKIYHFVAKSPTDPK